MTKNDKKWQKITKNIYFLIYLYFYLFFLIIMNGKMKILNKYIFI